MGLFSDLRRHPGQAAEVAVLHAVPTLAAQVEAWHRSLVARHPGVGPDALARQEVRRAARVARRCGAITGSSFYVGMVPALALIYLEQILLVLRVGAIYGQAPTAAARAPEILVVQGAQPDVAAAVAALRRAGTSSDAAPERSVPATARQAVRQVPSMIGLRVRRLRARGPMDLLVLGVEVASFLIPLVSIPAWAIANARATRRLGRAAIAFYAGPVDGRGASDVPLPARPSRRARRWTIALGFPVAVGFGVLAALYPVGRFRLGVVWVGVALAELALLLTCWRLARVTRPAPAACTRGWRTGAQPGMEERISAISSRSSAASS
jgi:hypothetical protein